MDSVIMRFHAIGAESVPGQIMVVGRIRIMNVSLQRATANQDLSLVGRQETDISQFLLATRELATHLLST
jgi:hypothetical protein